MVEIVQNQDLNEIIKTVDMNQSLLLTGKGETNYAINKIAYYDTSEAVFSAYGDSDLYNAFNLAKRIGVPHVFLVNVKEDHDYIDLINIIKHYDFAYIAPINLFLGDAFHDSTRNDKKISYYHYFLEQLIGSTSSTFVVTDNHAQLYEDIDSYLEEMMSIMNRFKSEMTANMDGKNLCFVANNLQNYDHANVLLASTLCITDLGEYPSFGGIGPVVYDIDAVDIKEQEMAYFKNNHLSGNTIENLLNFNYRVEPEKIVTVSRIVKHIKRNLDLSRFKGKQMSAYQKIRIERALDDFFNPLIDWILKSYQVNSIQFIKDVPGAGTVLCDIDIWPSNSIEKFSVVMEG